MLKKQISKEVAIQRLETLCVRGEQCRYDLQEKLRRWGIFPSEWEEILDSLEERRFFSDSRFAAAFAHDKMLFNRWGKMKITMALRAKRIPSSLIREALDELSDEEYERTLREFLQAKARSIPNLTLPDNPSAEERQLNYEARTKLYRAALSRGFESPLISRLLKEF